MARKPSSQGYEQPGDPNEAAGGARGEEMNAGFDSPDAEQALVAEATEAEVSMFLAGVDSQLLAAKAEIEKLLGASAGAEAMSQSDEAMAANVVGVGIGMGGDGTDFGHGAPGDPVLEVYTIEPEAAQTSRARLASAVGISALAGSDFPVHIVTTGIIDAQAHRFRDRPSPGGISAGTARRAGDARSGSTGTRGALARGLLAPRNNRLLVLSNNHVFADTNVAPLGCSLIQQGWVDGGVHPADQIAILERVVPISFAAGAQNQVDAATGWAWPDRVRREQVYLSGGARAYYRTGSVPVAAFLGQRVGKSGRTTQLTNGSVTAVGVTINVNYGAAGVARFVNQIAIRAASGNFSDRGDSGSLIWTWNVARAPVGLLFAGGGGTTFANPIARVLAALQIALVA